MEHYISGSSLQNGYEVHANCLRCNKPITSLHGAHSWALSLDEGGNCILLDDEQVSSPVFGLCHYGQVGTEEQILGSGQRHGIKHDFGEIMKHINDLENQIRLVRNENSELKRALTRLFSLAQATHTEVKHQNIKIAEKVGNLEEALGSFYPHKVRKDAHLETMSSKIVKFGRKLEKLKSEMVQTGTQAVISSVKDGNAESEGIVLDTCPHP